LQKESEAPKEAIPESTQESTLTEQLNTEIQAPKEVVEEDSKVQVKVEHSQVEAVSKERNVPSLVEQSKGEEPNIPSPLEHSETEDQQSSVESSSLLKVQPLLGQSDIKGFEAQEEPATVFEDLNVPPLVEHLENEDPHSSALPSNLLEAQPLLEQPGIKVVEVQNESIIRKVQSHVVHSKIEPIQAPVSSSFFNRWGFWTFLFMILLALLAAFSGAMSSILAATPVPLHSNDHVQPPLGLNTTQCEWDYLPHVPKELMVLSLQSATEHKQPTPTATPTPTSTQSPNALPNEQPSSNVLETLRNTASKAAESPAKVAGLATVVGLVVGAVHYGPTIWAHFMK
jgi:hypothetical protein